MSLFKNGLTGLSLVIVSNNAHFVSFRYKTQVLAQCYFSGSPKLLISVGISVLHRARRQTFKSNVIYFSRLSVSAD